MLVRKWCTRVAATGATCGIAIAGAPLPANAQGTGTGTGTLTVTVTASQTQTPLPYAVVALPQRSIERFTDASGRITIVSLVAGRYELVVRRIGFAPSRDTVIIAPAAVTSLAVALTQIPVQLTSMLVRPRERCTSPGMPDHARDAEVYQIVDMLRQNAAQFRLLTTEYPFRYATQRVLAAVSDSAMFVQSVDTLVAESSALGGYRPGRVVREAAGPRGRAETTMILPVLSDLAAPSFIENHCFRYGGTVQENGETWVRLDVLASEKLRTPDVNGAFFLDSTTAQLRRMELEMSRPDRLPTRLKSIRALTVATTFREITPGLSLIDGVCAINWQKTEKGRPISHPAELQQLTAYRFANAPPDAPSQSMYPTLTWRRATQVSRELLWCGSPRAAPNGQSPVG